MLVDAALGLEGSPNLVARMLEACPEARVIVLGDDHDADLLLAGDPRRRRRRGGQDLRRQHGAAGRRGRVLDGEGASPEHAGA